MSEHPGSIPQGGVPHGGAPDPHARPKGHEREIDRDINVRGIAWTVFGLFLLTVVSMFAMWWMFESLLASELERDPEPPPLVEARRQGVPAGPRLQASPERDLEQFRARENAMKTSYGWRDEAAGVVRIPVGRAMELVADEGLEGAMAAMAPGSEPATLSTGGTEAGIETGTDPGAAAAVGAATRPVAGASNPAVAGPVESVDPVAATPNRAPPSTPAGSADQNVEDDGGAAGTTRSGAEDDGR